MNPSRNSCLNSPVIPKSIAKEGKKNAPLNPRNEQVIPSVSLISIIKSSETRQIYVNINQETKEFEILNIQSSIT